MATLSSLYIYILDSNIYNADPENITLSSEGVYYCKIKIKRNFRYKARLLTPVEPLFGQKGLVVKDGLGFKDFPLVGLVATRAEVGYIDDYYTAHSKAGSDDDYICVKYASNDYFPFSDNTGTSKEIAPGRFDMFDFMESKEDPLVYGFRGNFQVVW